MSMAEDLLFRLSRRCLRRPKAGDGDEIERTLSQDQYRAWRDSELKGQLEDNFDTGTIAGRDVLDFGCGAGSLSLLIAKMGARSVVGMDLSTDSIESARKRAEVCNMPDVSFEVATDPAKIVSEDESFDLICCFDVMEHVICPNQIMGEWRRVLRPGGEVWIWWSQWRHPYGHHLQSLIPLPWVHLLFTEEALIRVCRRVYDDPCFVPRIWDIDPATQQKLPNKWANGADLGSWLNKLTLRDVKGICRSAGLRCQCRGFGFHGGGVRRAVRLLAHLPWVSEFFTSYYAIILKRSGRA